MDNQPQPTNQMPKSTAWIIIIVIIIILGVGGYFLLTQDEETNTNNANTVLNTKAVTNENTNTVSNTNTVANTNTVVNSNTSTTTNTNVDTSGWKKYENSEYGFAFSYPNDWVLSESDSTQEIYVQPRYFQEPIPLFNTFEGDFQDALDWLNSRPGQNISFSETGESYTLDNVIGKQISNEGFSTYAIIEFTNYSILLLIPDQLLDKDGTYKEIIETFSQ